MIVDWLAVKDVSAQARSEEKRETDLVVVDVRVDELRDSARIAAGFIDAGMQTMTRMTVWGR